jgi:TRAP-type mannitol/chloroaromatic compound transport system substrate-binding protein
LTFVIHRLPVTQFTRNADDVDTGWHEPGSELQFLINLKKYNTLPKDLQAILITAMKLAAYDMYADHDKQTHPPMRVCLNT